MKNGLLLSLLFFAAACLCTNAQNGPVSCYGQLEVSGNNIVGANTGGTPVQVKGVSLGWTNTGWESAGYYNSNSASQFIDVWNAEIIRAAMGTEGNGGYQSDASANVNRIKTVVNTALSKDVYVIIDWHAHNVQTTEAKAFFSEMAQEFGHYDNIIFEVYNEPIEQDWNTIKTYANEIIAEIRKFSDNLILVGTPFYSQYLHQAVSGGAVTDSENNTAYVLHFYAATHSLTSSTTNGYTFREEIENARDAGMAVFISEWGSCSADGNGSINEDNTNAWHQFLDEHKISSCAWQASHKNEAAAFFTTDISNDTNASSWSNTSNMRDNGKYVCNLLQTHAQAAVWRNDCSGCETKYTVTFNPDNDEPVFSQEICAEMRAFAPSKPQKPGFVFAGWYNGNILYDFTTKVIGNISLKARWGTIPGATLIADCENANQTALCTDWFSYSDVDNGGASSVYPNMDGTPVFTMTSGGANETAHAAKMTYSLDNGSYSYEPFVGMGFDLQEDGLSPDLSSASGITFYHKGNSVHVKMVMESLATTGKEHFYTVTASTDWQKITLSFDSDFIQPNWVSPVSSLDLSEITQILFQVLGTSSADKSSGEVWIDQVQIDGIQLERLCKSPCGTTIYTVTFDLDNGDLSTQQSVCENDYLFAPDDPQRSEYIFQGWYNGDDLFSFATPITENINLKAKWQKDPATTILNEKITNPIYIYPNPATETFFISGISGQAVVTIYNLTGKILKSEKVNLDSPIAIHAEKGIYFVRVEGENNVFTKHLVIE